MRIKFALLILFLSLVSFIAPGCNKTADDQTMTQPQENSASEKQSPGELSDAEITAEVKTKFMSDENVASRRIDIETEDGVVTLRGMVATPTEAERAVELAKTAEGVRMVHSYLKSDAPAAEGDKTSDLGQETEEALEETGEAIDAGVEQAQKLGSDAAITAQIKWKLAKDRMVQAADIDVDTKNRHVTLTGIVSNREEAHRAVQIAQSVDHVLLVDSNLTIR